MKYFVAIDGQELEVVIDGERVTVDGRTVEVHQSTIQGTPLRQVVIDGRPLLVPLERHGPGRWSVTAWGERTDVTVLTSGRGISRVWSVRQSRRPRGVSSRRRCRAWCYGS